MNKYFKKIYWVLSSQFGINPKHLIYSIVGLPKYIRDLFNFKRKYHGKIELVPCLRDWYEEGGSTKNEYFWQDLLVARKIFEANPKTHVDIGSRVDGFVAHVASFREIEVFDVRPITTKIPGILFEQADLMQSLQEKSDYCDSLSSLHALEHFGLGRYGDPIDSHGFKRGLCNMAYILRSGGKLYLSVPIGIERVEFNANRVFDPRTIVLIAREFYLQLKELTVIQAGGNLIKVDIEQSNLAEWADQRYALGVFVFEKN